jgi:hypothetical protein
MTTTSIPRRTGGTSIDRYSHEEIEMLRDLLAFPTPLTGPPDARWPLRSSLPRSLSDGYAAGPEAKQSHKRHACVLERKRPDSLASQSE